MLKNITYNIVKYIISKRFLNNYLRFEIIINDKIYIYIIFDNNYNYKNRACKIILTFKEFDNYIKEYRMNKLKKVIYD